MTEKEMIRGCLQNDRRAQRALYDQYAARLYGVCLRYMKARQDAEDAMAVAMHKILTKLDKYSGSGSLYGWMKRVTVNECLMELRKRKLQFTDIDDVAHRIDDDSRIEDSIYFDDLKALIDRLPPGYRTVINLYLIEGYKHREIAELLGISINTSKSQLILAKKKMREYIAAQEQPTHIKDNNHDQ